MYYAIAHRSRLTFRVSHRTAIPLAPSALNHSQSVPKIADNPQKHTSCRHLAHFPTRSATRESARRMSAPPPQHANIRERDHFQAILMQLRYNFVIAAQRGTWGKEATMFDIRTAWRRLAARISGDTNQETIDAIEARNVSDSPAPATVTPAPTTVEATGADAVPAPAPSAPTTSGEAAPDDAPATRPARVISLGEVWVDIMMDVDSLPKAGGFAASRSTIPTIDGSYRALLASRLMGTPTAHAGIIGAGPLRISALTGWTSTPVSDWCSTTPTEARRSSPHTARRHRAARTRSTASTCSRATWCPSAATR